MWNPPTLRSPVFERDFGFWTWVSWKCGFTLVSFNSQTTDWYKWTYYCAEAPSVLSSFAFLFVAAVFNFRPLYFAGAASIISHCIPFQVFLTLDKVGVAVALLALVRRAPSVLFMLPFAVCLGLLAFAELHLRRRGWHNVHDFWHVGAAILAAVYLCLVTNTPLPQWWKSRLASHGWPAESTPDYLRQTF